MPFTYTNGPNASFSSTVAVALSATAAPTQVTWHICAISYFNASVLAAPDIRHPNAKVLGFQTRADGLHMAVFAVPQNSANPEFLSVSVGAGVAGLRRIVSVTGADNNDPVEQINFTTGSNSTATIVMPGHQDMGRIDFIAALTDNSTTWTHGANQSGTAGMVRALGVSAMAMDSSFITNENIPTVTATWASMSSAAQWIHCAISLKPYNGTL